jgi:hypothetical protein
LIKINSHCSVRHSPSVSAPHDLDVRQSGKRTQTRSTPLPLAKGLEVVMFKHILIATD